MHTTTPEKPKKVTAAKSKETAAKSKDVAKSKETAAKSKRKLMMPRCQQQIKGCVRRC